VRLEPSLQQRQRTVGPRTVFSRSALDPSFSSLSLSLSLSTVCRDRDPSTPRSEIPLQGSLSPTSDPSISQREIKLREAQHGIDPAATERKAKEKAKQRKAQLSKYLQGQEAKLGLQQSAVTGGNVFATTATAALGPCGQEEEANGRAERRARRETMGHMLETLLMEAAEVPAAKDTSTVMQERAVEISTLFASFQDLSNRQTLETSHLQYLQQKSTGGQAVLCRELQKRLAGEEGTISREGFVAALGFLTATLTESEFCSLMRHWKGCAKELLRLKSIAESKAQLDMESNSKRIAAMETETRGRAVQLSGVFDALDFDREGEIEADLLHGLAGEMWSMKKSAKLVSKAGKPCTRSKAGSLLVRKEDFIQSCGMMMLRWSSEQVAQVVEQFMLRAKEIQLDRRAATAAAKTKKIQKAAREKSAVSQAKVDREVFIERGKKAATAVPKPVDAAKEAEDVVKAAFIERGKAKADAKREADKKAKEEALLTERMKRLEQDERTKRHRVKQQEEDDKLKRELEKKDKLRANRILDAAESKLAEETEERDMKLALLQASQDLEKAKKSKEKAREEEIKAQAFADCSKFRSNALSTDTADSLFGSSVALREASRLEKEMKARASEAKIKADELGKQRENDAREKNAQEMRLIGEAKRKAQAEAKESTKALTERKVDRQLDAIHQQMARLGVVGATGKQDNEELNTPEEEAVREVASPSKGQRRVSFSSQEPQVCLVDPRNKKNDAAKEWAAMMKKQKEEQEAKKARLRSKDGSFAEKAAKEEAMQSHRLHSWQDPAKQKRKAEQEKALKTQEKLKAAQAQEVAHSKAKAAAYAEAKSAREAQDQQVWAAAEARRRQGEERKADREAGKEEAKRKKALAAQEAAQEASKAKDQAKQRAERIRLEAAAVVHVDNLDATRGKTKPNSSEKANAAPKKGDDHLLARWDPTPKPTSKPIVKPIVKLPSQIEAEEVKKAEEKRKRARRQTIAVQPPSRSELEDSDTAMESSIEKGLSLWGARPGSARRVKKGETLEVEKKALEKLGHAAC